MIDYATHPISLLMAWTSSLRSDDVLHFSHYKYVPQSPFDQRINVEVSVEQVSMKWFCEGVAKLEPGRDLAWHSLVCTSNGYARHVPMVDFSTELKSARERRLVYEQVEKCVGQGCDSIVAVGAATDLLPFYCQ